MRFRSAVPAVLALAVLAAGCSSARESDSLPVAHASGWIATSATGVTPHGRAANHRDPSNPLGLAGCRSCHGASLVDTSSGATSCDTCHGGGGAAWRTDCTFCHGDAARAPAGPQLADAAPPFDVAGLASSAAVGAHLAHLSGNATAPISAGVACGACHTVPSSVDDHVDGITSVVLRDPAGAPSGAYDRASGTCATTYCHGAFPGGSGASAPAWTGTGTCTSCHGSAPATGKHEFHSWYSCTVCHFDVAASASAIKPGGRALHVNGAKDVRLATREGVVTGAWNGILKTCTTECHLRSDIPAERTWYP